MRLEPSRLCLFCAVLSLDTTAAGAPLHLLFWQGTDIREGHNVSFTAHPFTESDRTVLLPADPDRPSLWYMPTDVVRVDGETRIYYQRVEKSLPDHFDQRTWCFGVLKDGKLVLPDLKLYPSPWGGPANVVLRRSPHKPSWGGFNVFQMIRDDDHGYRLLYWDQPAEGAAGALLATSQDGIHWEKDEARAVFTEHNDAYTLTVDPDGEGFLLYQTKLEDWPDKPFIDNIGPKRRVITIRRSSDLMIWTPQETILRPDRQDAPSTEFYLMKVFRHADRWVGLVMVYYADPKRPNKHSGILRHELVLSRDGRAWERPYRYTDMGIWTYADPFEFQARLNVVAHHKSSLSMFSTRLDGLASCGSEGEGSFWTPPFEIPAGSLVLNADCSQGTIGVEILDEKGTVIEGYGQDACAFSKVDSADLPLKWGERNTESLRGRTVHLRFDLRNARVFSIRSR